jgi:hypothetical protein
LYSEGLDLDQQAARRPLIELIGYGIEGNKDLGLIDGKTSLG